MNSIAPRSWSASTPARRDQLVGCGQVRRHGPAVVPDVQVELRRREPDRALGRARRASRPHMASISSGVAARSDASSPITHRRSAQWPTLAATLTPIRPSSPSRKSPNDPPREGDARRPALGRHALDPAEHLQQPADVVGLGRREGEPAVAGEHGGDAVPRRRRRGRLEVQLGVVVGVDVDEPGGDVEPVGVDDPCAASPSTPPTSAIRPSRDADVGGAAGRAGAVDHRARPRMTSRSPGQSRPRGLDAVQPRRRCRRAAWPGPTAPSPRCARAARRRRRGTWRRCAGSPTPR